MPVTTRLFTIAVIALVIFSCSKDDMSSNPKGIVKFKSYTAAGGLRPLIFVDGSIRFIVELQLNGTRQNLNADVTYHLLDGEQKLREGKVKVNQNLDGGLGMFWGSEEHSVAIDMSALSGKTLTIYLDPSHALTASEYTTQTYIDLYKKASITIP